MYRRRRARPPGPARRVRAGGGALTRARVPPQPGLALGLLALSRRASGLGPVQRLRTPGRVSPRLGGVSLGPGRGPSWPCGVAPRELDRQPPGQRRPRLASTRPRLLLVHMFGAPALPRIKTWHAPRYCQAEYCDSDKGMRPVGHSQRASPGTAAPRGKTPPGYAAATSRLTPRARLDLTAHRRQNKDAPRLAAGQGLAPSACGAGALAAARGPATVRFAC